MKKLEAQIKNRYLGSRSGSVSVVRRRTSVQLGNTPRIKGGEIKVRKTQLNPARLTEEDARSQLVEIADIQAQLHSFDPVKAPSRKAVGALSDRCTFMERKINLFVQRMWPSEKTD